jgi:hypothetical protein
MSAEIGYPCEFKGAYLDYDEDYGEMDVLKCTLFTHQGIWDAYCDEDQKCEDCMLYRFVNEVFVKKYGVGDEFKSFKQYIEDLKKAQDEERIGG